MTVNTVHSIMNTAGVSFSRDALGTATTVGGMQAHAQDCVANLGILQTIAHAVAAKSEPSSGSTSIKEPSGMGKGLTAAALMGAMMFNPVIGAVGGIIEGANFIASALKPGDHSVGHFAVKGSKAAAGGSSYSLAASAATFDQKTGDMLTYQPACEDASYCVKSGQQIASPAPAAPPRTTEEKLFAAVGEMDIDPKLAQQNIQKLFAENLGSLGKTDKRLEQITGINPEYAAGIDPRAIEDTFRPKGNNNVIPSVKPLIGFG